MRSRHVVWIVFACLVVAAGLHYHLSDSGPEESNNGAGGCACFGFILLIVLLVGTVLEVVTTRRKREARGFDVIPGGSGSPGDQDEGRKF